MITVYKNLDTFFVDCNEIIIGSDKRMTFTERDQEIKLEFFIENIDKIHLSQLIKLFENV